MSIEVWAHSANIVSSWHILFNLIEVNRSKVSCTKLNLTYNGQVTCQEELVVRSISQKIITENNRKPCARVLKKSSPGRFRAYKYITFFDAGSQVTPFHLHGSESSGLHWRRTPSELTTADLKLKSASPMNVWVGCLSKNAHVDPRRCLLHIPTLK